MIRGLAALLMLGAGVPAQAQLRELTTDRPDRTESPITVDRGHVQLEMDAATWTRDRAAGTVTKTWSIAPFNLKYGIADDTDLQLVVEPYLRRVTHDRAGRRGTTSGVGDLTLRVKHNVWRNDGGTTALGVMPFVTLPTNHRDLGDDRVTGGVIVPLSVALSKRIALGVMTEVDLVEADDGDYAASLVNSATLGLALDDRLSLYGEVYTERTIADGAAWRITGDAGVTYRLTDNLQLDAGTNVGLTRAADDLQLFVGVSRRF